RRPALICSVSQGYLFILAASSPQGNNASSSETRLGSLCVQALDLIDMQQL
ncbi:hypothetical protein EJB05_29097, partial [Eragrostis curvula]